MKHPDTHLIIEWSGEHADETPVCGADKWATDVWGWRTENVAYVTCKKCLKAFKTLPKKPVDISDASA